MHEITPEFFRSKYGLAESAIVIRLLTLLEKICFTFADHVITINHPIRDLLERRGLSGEKSTVIINAADEARFTSCASLAADENAVQPVSFVMMYHGTLTRIYGLDIAIEAFSRARKDMPGAELWILGSGPETGALASLIQDRGLVSQVKLLGQVASTDIPAWLSQCDVGVLPIRQDMFLDYAFPNKLPEYIITGKAVVIARLKAIQHYFSDEALAYFEPNDPVALSEQMVRLYGDRALRTQLSANAAAQYAPIRWDVTRQRYLDLITHIAGSARVSAEQSRIAHTTP
jgi:glycosyltransferase involved in cell wall biosynthesis